MKNALREAHVFESTYPVGQPYVMERRIKHYSSFHQILLVGEGDFSFSSALANAFGSAHNMVATSLDSREKVMRIYKSARVWTVMNLINHGAMVLHGVDATTMDELDIIKDRMSDRIVFNFPHAGFCGKESDRAVIKKHRHLVKMFLKNARTMLSSTGEIHVAHKEKHPYDKWKLVKQAEKFGLVLKESVNFYLADYPGYTNRRGDGFYSADTFFLGPCKTYKFILGPLVFDPSHLLPIKPRHRTWGASNFDRDEEIFEESDFFLERGAWGTVLWIV
eukprot:Gb_11797 [translate_table: standard]